MQDLTRQTNQGSDKGRLWASCFHMWHDGPSIFKGRISVQRCKCHRDSWTFLWLIRPTSTSCTVSSDVDSHRFRRSSQKWIKENVVWYPNGTMSYSTRKLYTFEPSMSVGDHSSDVITTANVPVISAYHQNKDSNFFISFGIEKLVHE